MTGPLLLLLGALGQELPEVRQIVTLQFLPGKTEEAVEIFRNEALPVYEEHAPMLRFRGYREAESPEPMDLVVVSTFRGMAGMDAFNDSVRTSGVSLGELYGRIGALMRGHRDEFVEMETALSWGDTDGAALVALVSIRLVPGKSDDYEKLVRDRLIPREKELGTVRGSESGRFLLSNGWDYFRIIGLSSLGDWQAYRSDEKDTGLIVESKQILVAPVPELSVR